MTTSFAFITAADCSCGGTITAPLLIPEEGTSEENILAEAQGWCASCGKSFRVMAKVIYEPLDQDDGITQDEAVVSGKAEAEGDGSAR